MRDIELVRRALELGRAHEARALAEVQLARVPWWQPLLRRRVRNMLALADVAAAAWRQGYRAGQRRVCPSCGVYLEREEAQP